MEKLKQQLQRIDGKGYKAYKDIKGVYDFKSYTLSIDHVQGDPFAAPSRVSIQTPMTVAQFPREFWESRNDSIIRRVALEDFIARAVKKTIKQSIKGNRGSGCSGIIAIDTSGQQIMRRNAIIIEPQQIDTRIVMGLPANGRRVAGRQAIEMFFNELPAIVEQALHYANQPADSLKHHVESAEDQHVLRQQLEEQKLVAFVANGAVLPRRSGIDDRPLAKDVIRFRSPSSLEREIHLPNSGPTKGMGIPEGVTLIVGGGFHGKSTLLHALERGPYNHIPGDGREKIVTDPTAVKVRAEDGRAISKVNISPFIDRLPFGRDTKQFTTENASGSTSQAANIIEAFECGAQVLLIDEDTCATNFMIRDQRMQTLVAKEKEPITPLVNRIRELYEQHGVSSVIVMGGSGDYFDIADTVIMMDAYEPHDVSEQAKALARENNPAIADTVDDLPPFQRHSQRVPGPKTLDASRRNRDVKIDTKELQTLLYGEHRIDLSLVEQLVDIGQTRAIGLMILRYAQRYASDHDTLVAGLQKLIEDVENRGLDIISPYKVGNLAMPRLYELAAAINRIRDGDWRGD
ncbi:MAG: ABC-ATPase domain-containing protein [Gammaproteobacteria bacterium]|jgi:predicted ABC-class ATPase